MGNNKITFEQFCDPSFIRAEQMKVKTEAVWVMFLELGGLINISKFAEKYFERTHGWFSHKLNHNTVNGKPAAFTAEECDRIAASMRDLAARLNDYAAAIDAAADTDTE